MCGLITLGAIGMTSLLSLLAPQGKCLVHPHLEMACSPLVRRHGRQARSHWRASTVCSMTVPLYGAVRSGPRWTNSIRSRQNWRNRHAPKDVCGSRPGYGLNLKRSFSSKGAVGTAQCDDLFPHDSPEHSPHDYCNRLQQTEKLFAAKCIIPLRH